MPDSNPLTPEQQQQIAEATERAASINSAARLAMFNAWTIGIFAALSALFALRSVTALVMAVGLGIIARNEFTGSKRFRGFDDNVPSFLGRNQLALMALIVGYAVVSIYRATSQPMPDLAELEEFIGPVQDLVRSIAVFVYAAVIVLTVLFQGLNARYYFTRKRVLDDYLSSTPAWIVDLQRKTRRT